jgi:cytochrome d ubiquinol oxidase subunit I
MMELGWLITEFGRQSWTVAGKLSTADAMTKGADIQSTQYVFVALFAILTVASLFALSYTTRHWRKTEKSSW